MLVRPFAKVITKRKEEAPTPLRRSFSESELRTPSTPSQASGAYVRPKLQIQRPNDEQTKTEEPEPENSIDEDLGNTLAPPGVPIRRSNSSSHDAEATPNLFAPL